MSGKNPIPNPQAYEGVKAVNPPEVVTSTVAPSSNFIKYPLGTLWINKSTNKVYQLAGVSGAAATWQPMLSGVSGISSAMVAGTTTVTTSAVTASSVIITSRATLGGTPGHLSVGTITAGTSFVINSSSGTDTSTVAWMILTS